MNEKLVVIGSITYAFRAKEILKNKNINAYIERNSLTREYGCGYALYIPKNFDNAVEILKSNSIKILAVISRGEE